MPVQRRAHAGVATRIIGVVLAHATAYQLSFRQGRATTTPVSTELADGLACRVPDPQALEVICREVDDVVAVTDVQGAAAMCALFADTHHIAEGAGAAALAGALVQQTRWAGRRVGLPLTGGYVDTPMFAQVLAGAKLSVQLRQRQARASAERAAADSGKFSFDHMR